MGRYVLDRFEKGLAVLEDEGGTMRSVPAEKLPSGLREGAVLEESGGRFFFLKAETEHRDSQIKKRVSDLFKNNNK